jgi:hypothetical protein
LGVDDVVILRVGIGVGGLDPILGNLFHMGKHPHGVPPMVTLSCVDDPVLIPHHLVETTKQLHIKGRAEDHHHQQQQDVFEVHGHER